jgi:hypothetical protein
MKPFEHISIRRASSSDAEALHRLAALDSKRLPAGEHLIADVDGEPWAAVSLQTGEVVADPFLPTAHVAELLQVRVERMQGSVRRRARRPRPLARRLTVIRPLG